MALANKIGMDARAREVTALETEIGAVDGRWRCGERAGVR